MRESLMKRLLVAERPPTSIRAAHRTMISRTLHFTISSVRDQCSSGIVIITPDDVMAKRP
jgi:hypothetical protein